MKLSLLILCIIGLSIVTCGCSVSDQNVLPSSKYAAVLVEIRDDGTLVSGYNPYPGMAQPPLAFFYNKSAPYPPDGFPYQMNESSKVLLGIYNIKDSNVRLTTDLNVTDIHDLPFSFEPGLTISSVDKNGVIEISYGNGSINLQPGSSWIVPITSAWNETETVKYPPPDWSTGIDNGTNYTYTIHFVRMYTIENKGLFDK